MKLRCKLAFLIGIIVITIFSGCINDDYDDCPKGINISFYSKSPCQLDTVYPEQVKDMLLCVFDKNGVLVAYQKRVNVELNKEYSEKIEVGNGLYSVIAWSGISDSRFDINELQNGVTKKSDLMFRLKRIQAIASSLENTNAYFGESPAVYVETVESAYVNTAVNLLEMTNRLTITIEGLPDNGGDYEVYVESDNGSMNLDGTIAEDEIIKHESAISSEAGVLTAKLTLLKLETGYTNTIVIKNKTNGTELYRGSLLGTLLLKNPEVNLNCDHDFTIKFTAEDQCSCGTYTIMKIWVNNWLVHSYDAEM